MIRLACFLLITVLFLSAQAAQADTVVIKYKKYLIPIKLPPEIEAPTLTATRESNNTVLLDASPDSKLHHLGVDLQRYGVDLHPCECASRHRGLPHHTL